MTLVYIFAMDSNVAISTCVFWPPGTIVLGGFIMQVQVFGGLPQNSGQRHAKFESSMPEDAEDLSAMPLQSPTSAPSAKKRRLNKRSLMDMLKTVILKK